MNKCKKERGREREFRDGGRIIKSMEKRDEFFNGAPSSQTAICIRIHSTSAVMLLESPTHPSGKIKTLLHVLQLYCKTRCTVFKTHNIKRRLEVHVGLHLTCVLNNTTLWSAKFKFTSDILFSRKASILFEAKSINSGIAQSSSNGTRNRDGLSIKTIG